MSMFEGKSALLCPDPPISLFILGNMLQNLRVSSPAPVTILEPQGLIDR
jgi:hypothetical protein